MRIFFTGTHRTGKTTLAKEVAERLNLTFLPTNVSDIIEKHSGSVADHLGNDGSIESKLKTQFIVASKLNSMLENNDDIVTDRSLIDVLAYTNYIVRDVYPKPQIYDEVVAVCMGGKFAIADNFIVRINQYVAFDPTTKSGDLLSQQMIENNIMETMDLFNTNLYCKVKVIPKNINELQSRVDWVLKNVN